MSIDSRTIDRLLHMHAAIVAIERLAKGVTPDEYDRDPDRAAAVERYFEKLSEASRHLPQPIKDAYPHIPWRQIADLGNILRHAYDQVASERILGIVSDDLPILKKAVEALLARQHLRA